MEQLIKRRKPFRKGLSTLQVQGMPFEARLKLKLLTLALDRSHPDLLTEMIDERWDRDADKVAALTQKTTTLTTRKVAESVAGFKVKDSSLTNSEP